MKLIEDFAYIDQFGKEWQVPKGSIIDGASIPRFLWSVIGSPFTGDYREASIVMISLVSKGIARGIPYIGCSMTHPVSVGSER